ncbi:MAG: carboxypeptidase-like regulatory domain-containing protein [Chitinophagaceae bacterium]|nr:MAG: carboxypeptidase-like regulatory domain-containing protein [Chitinophagaceae bacterium]
MPSNQTTKTIDNMGFYAFFGSGREYGFSEMTAVHQRSKRQPTAGRFGGCCKMRRPQQAVILFATTYCAASTIAKSAAAGVTRKKKQTPCNGFNFQSVYGREPKQHIMLRFLCFLLCIAGLETGLSQTTVKIVDAKTREGISYANVLVDSEHQISNAEGFFTIPDAKSTDETLVVVSYLGYAPVKTSVGALKNRNLVLELQEAAFELSEVNTSNVKPDPAAIMAGVKKNLAANYKVDNAMKSKLFIRRSDAFKPKVLNVEIEKSTGFKKSALKEANDDIQAFTGRLATHPPLEFNDMLVEYYSGATPKLEVLKAVKLQDESRAASLEGLEDKASKIFLKHIDTTKYYRFKSGWFGSRDTISMRKDFNKKQAKKEKTSKLANAKMTITNFMKKNNLLEGSDLEFVTHPEWYEYSYDGATYATADQFVWVLKFKPRKGKANCGQARPFFCEKDSSIILPVACDDPAGKYGS